MHQIPEFSASQQYFLHPTQAGSSIDRDLLQGYNIWICPHLFIFLNIVSMMILWYLNVFIAKLISFISSNYISYICTPYSYGRHMCYTTYSYAWHILCPDYMFPAWLHKMLQFWWILFKYDLSGIFLHPSMISWHL